MRKVWLVLPLSAGACASIVDGQNQSISLTTSPVSGAECKLSNSKGQWFVAETPGSVTVRRAYGDLVVDCNKDDSTGLVQVPSSTKGMAFGNILFGGIIGAGVDMANGSAYDYPVSVNVPLRKR